MSGGPGPWAAAVMRAHRIGQMRAVTATRFSTAGTIEERMHQLQDKKRQGRSAGHRREPPPQRLAFWRISAHRIVFTSSLGSTTSGGLQDLCTTGSVFPQKLTWELVV